jgi:hypothetical protein
VTSWRLAGQRDRERDAVGFDDEVVPGWPRFGDLGRDGTVSIWTVAGRQRTVRLVGNPHHLLLPAGQDDRPT